MDELEEDEEEEEESSSPPEGLLALKDLVIFFCISSLMDNLSDCRSNSFNLWLSGLLSLLVNDVDGDDGLYVACSLY